MKLKINYYKRDDIEESIIDIYYKDGDNETLGIIEYLNTYHYLLGKKDDVWLKLLPSDIFYCEMVDRKCYLYLEKEVVSVDFTLKDFETKYRNLGFVQISKVTLVNIYKIDFIKADFNMKLKIFMINGELVILNRAYKKSFMEFITKVKEDGYENN